MWKLVVAGATAVFVAAFTPAHAQTPSDNGRERLSAADWGMLTNARINLVKAALQLTPDQEKYWPAVEEAIRTRAEHRAARYAVRATRIGELRDSGPVEALRNRDPIAFLQRRADALAQRAADLKKLADAWGPLYQTLTPDQKQRMALGTIIVLRRIGNAVDGTTEDTEDTDNIEE
jgi:hypothetical protein